MKIYARQVPPEFQNSPLEFFSVADRYPEIIIAGNSYFKEHTTPLYDYIIQNYDDAAEYLDELKIMGRDRATYKNVTAIINDFFPASEFRDRPYTKRDIHQIRIALELYGTSDYYGGDYIVSMLAAITGKEYRSATIRGCCQSDWNDIVYPAADYSADDLDRLEIEYFNTGSEWIIHDGPDAPETENDISGYSVYCYGWNEDKIRAEIADAAGAAGADVILYGYY